MKSKRRKEYEDGLEQLNSFLEQFLDAAPPTREEIQAETRAIPAFRRILFDLTTAESANLSEGFILLIEERYERYDDLLPKLIHIRALPRELEERKELHRYLNLQSGDFS